MPLETVPNVLLSIKPEHAEAILDGSKGWEYRRVAPARDPPYRLVLYATAPVQAAVGVAWCDVVLERPVPVLVNAAVTSTPHSVDDVLEYFEGRQRGSALRVVCVDRWDEPVPRESLEAAGVAPSQNFRYINEVPADGGLPVEGVSV